jgi:ABC-type glycerol-3-phosphate transport system permease component
VTNDRPSDHKPSAALRTITRHVVIVAVIAFIAFPVLWAILTSFKSPSEIYSLSPLARHPTLANYQVAITQFPLGRLLLNTTVMAAGVTAGQVIVCVLAGYGFVAFRFRAKRLLYAATVGSILVPQTCLVIPDYLIVARLGWVNSYLGLIVPQIASCAFGVMLLTQHMEAIPASLVESAKLDGATSRQVLTRLVVPLLRPAISALAVLVFLSSWNEYLWPLLVASGSGNSTIQVGLALFQTQQGSEFGPMMAAATITMIPVLVVYLLNQRRVTDAFLHAGLR